MLLDSASQFIAGHSHSLIRPAAVGVPQSIDMSLWREMAGMGWLGLELNEPFAGSMGLHASALLAERFGQTAFLMPYVAASVIPAVLLSACPAGALTTELVNLLQSGQRIFTLAWQERLDELDCNQATVEVVAGRLRGIKRFVPAVEPNGLLLVSVRDAGRLAIAAISSDAINVSVVNHAAGLSRMSDVRFDDAPILNGECLYVGDAVAVALATAVNAGRVALSAQCAGLAQGMLDRTLAYVNGRIQFERPLGSFQAVQHRAVDLHILTRLAGASWRHALRSLQRDPSGAETQAAIAAAKARCADTAQRAGRDAIQLHGATGFTEEGGLGAYVRASMHGYSWLGTAIQHRRLFLTQFAGRSHD